MAVNRVILKGEVIDDDCMIYPLFMDSLPIDFSTNPSLAALASLLDDKIENKNADGKNRKASDLLLTSGGGKTKELKSRNSRKWAPYQTKQRPEKIEKQKTTVTETSLFLKMWKL